MPGAWSSIISSAASYLGNKSANDSTNAANLRNTQLNNELQERLSRTGHQREVKDLRAAGLNPILSARGSGSPQPSSAAAKVEPKPSLGSAAINAAQIALLHSQARKTSAEALNAELQEPYNRAISDVYSSILGAPAVAGKALGHVATGYGMYRGAKAVGRFMRKRKAKGSSLPKTKPLTSLQKQKLRKLHDLKTKSVLLVVVLVFVIMRVLIKRLVKLSLVGIVLKRCVKLLKVLNMVSVVMVAVVFVFVNII